MSASKWINILSAIIGIILMIALLVYRSQQYRLRAAAAATSYPKR